MKAARDYPILTVTAKGTRWLESGHPWVYDSDVAREPDESECENGALVDVVSEKGKYLGTGFLSRLSKLRVRIVSRNANDRFDEIFWQRRVRYAGDYRKAVMDGQTGCCRLIFGEADAFPGLTVDRFENLLVTQTLSLGMEKIKDMLFPLIVEVLEQDGETIDGLFERNDVVLREKEGLTQNKGWFLLPGKKTPESPITEICENGVFYREDVENGQKTGFFLDQKFNRLAVGWQGRCGGYGCGFHMRVLLILMGLSVFPERASRLCARVHAVLCGEHAVHINAAYSAARALRGHEVRVIL